MTAMPTGAAVSLRVRLLAAFASLVLALAALGAWSAWRLRDLGEVAERILADNYQSVEAAHAMRVSLERLEGLRTAAAGTGAGDAGGRRAFDRALAVAAGNVTEPGERDVIAALRAGYEEYARTPSAAGAERLRRSIAPLDRLNVAAMRSKSDAAGALARRDAAWTLALMAVLALGGAWLTAAVGRSVSGPIEALTRAATRAAAGDLDVAVPADRADELGQMARAFNHMAARVREARVSDRDALAQARQVAERMMLLEDVRHLHELNRLKSEFVAEASHELRTPLASLQLGLDLLHEQPATLTPRQREIVELCRNDGERLARLARDLLDLTRLESGQRPPRPAAVAVEGLVRGVVEPMRRQGDARGVTLAVDVPRGLPPAYADRAQIERVLTNLVSNALRATPAGGRVTVAASAEGGMVACRVIDTGIGIAPEHHARIFEPFAQIAGGARGGAGLGLAISRRIVEAHGGAITVASAPGAGSTFAFTLPRADGAFEEASDASPDRR
ncbi:MAG: HAMP domain-containing sensor histidine kinase [Vicinamibacterales bacterium]